ncbi:MAG: Ig-like domain repeat protein, partial [Terriglobales bacterium]
GINNSGQVVGVYSLSGQSYPGGPWHAYLWSQSAGLQDLGTLDGPSASSSATAINNNGQVVGSTDSPDCPNGSPFLWTAPTGMQLTLGCTPVIPTSINDDGQTVGQVVDPSGTFFDVVLWSPTEGVQILGPGVQVPWWPGEPAISDNGQVVGTAYQPSDNGDLPFMWSSETGTQYLNNLVPRGVSINYAGSINQLGQIIAWGNRFSYLLTPKMYTTLTSSLNPSYAGQSVTFTGTVSSIASPPPDGELVSFSEHGTPLGSAPLIGGVATFTTSSLPVGVLHIEATYVGDGTFEPSRPGKLKQVVKK